jgi:glycosyltransferase involved in cell wall biosynthesis
MRQNPEVTVILTNYNYSDYVCRAIKSVIAQDYEGQLNLVIVDDGSDDNSQAMIDYEFFADEESYERKTTKQSFYNGTIAIEETGIYNVNLMFIMTENRGASVARNVGINYGLKKYPKTKAIAILDADDEYYPNKISKLVSRLVEYEEIGVVYSDYDVEKTYGENSHTKREFKKPYSIIDLRNECIVSSGSLIRVDALKRIANKKEYYNPKLHGPKSKGFIGCTEDYDLWLRLSGVSIMCHVPESLSLAREHGDNQSLKMTTEIFQKNAQIMMGG